MRRDGVTARRACRSRSPRWLHKIHHPAIRYSRGVPRLPPGASCEPIHPGKPWAEARGQRVHAAIPATITPDASPPNNAPGLATWAEARSRLRPAGRPTRVTPLVFTHGPAFETSQRIATRFFDRCEERIDVFIARPCETQKRRGRDSFGTVFEGLGISAIPDAMSMPVNDL